jgi:uncharacterized membrane protein YqjE
MADPQGGGAGPGEATDPSLFASLRSFWSVLLAILYTRLDLCTTELQDQGIRVIKLLLAGLVAVIAFVTAFFFVNVWIIAACWYANRLLAIGIIVGVYFLIGLFCALAARNMIASWPGLLSQTIKELRRDVEGLSALAAKDKEQGK